VTDIVILVAVEDVLLGTTRAAVAGHHCSGIASRFCTLNGPDVMLERRRTATFSPPDVTEAVALIAVKDVFLSFGVWEVARRSQIAIRLRALDVDGPCVTFDTTAGRLPPDVTDIATMVTVENVIPHQSTSFLNHPDAGRVCLFFGAEASPATNWNTMSRAVARRVPVPRINRCSSI
jgi:hypothetical protein